MKGVGRQLGKAAACEAKLPAPPVLEWRDNDAGTLDIPPDDVILAIEEQQPEIAQPSQEGHTPHGEGMSLDPGRTLL